MSSLSQSTVASRERRPSLTWALPWWGSARLRHLSAGLAGTLLALLAWQFASNVLLKNPNLPSATATLLRLSSLVGGSAFWTEVGQTLITSLVGFAVCLLVAIPVGVWTGTSRLAQHGFHVLIEVFKPIPPIVILPLVVLKAGSTELMAEILVVFAVAPSLAVVVAAGVRDTDPVALNTARAFGLSRWARVRRVVFPSMVPFLSTGMRISITSAVMVTIMAELIAGAPGLGAEVNVARAAGDPIATFAYVVAVGILGVIVTYGIGAVERRLLHWHPAVAAAREGRRSASIEAARAWLGAQVRERVGEQFTAAADRLDLMRVGLLRPLYARRARQRPRVGRPANDNPASSMRFVGAGLEIAVPLALIAAWWFWSASAHNLYFPPLSSILTAFRDTWLFSHFSSDVAPSLVNLGAGLGIGGVAGLFAGVLMAEVRALDELFEPAMNFLRSIPGVAYVPIMILLVGFTAPMRIVSIALAVTFPVLIATIDGLRGRDRVVDQVSRVYSLSPLRRLVMMRLPAAAPRIAAGIEVAIAAAVMVMVASELEGTVHGIGAQTVVAQQNFEVPDMWAGILLLALIGLGLNLIYHAIRVRALRWYYLSRAGGRAA